MFELDLLFKETIYVKQRNTVLLLAVSVCVVEQMRHLQDLRDHLVLQVGYNTHTHTHTHTGFYAAVLAPLCLTC